MTVRVGITGQSGFIGSHLSRMFVCSPGFEVVDFHRFFFNDPLALHDFAGSCDVIIHLAGLSRHPDPDYLYRTNVELAGALLAASPHGLLMLGSTVYENRDSAYHASKRKIREMFDRGAADGSYSSRTLLMPNTFGCGSRPGYNSVVSTFCAAAARGIRPERIDSAVLELMYIEDLCRIVRASVLRPAVCSAEKETIEPDWRIPLRELWDLLYGWSRLRKDELPVFRSRHEIDLWQTYSSYADRRP